MSSRKTNKEFLKELENAQHGKLIPLDEYTTKRTSIRFKCRDCGHEFSTLPGNVIKKNPTSCPKCSAKRVTDEEFKEKLKNIHNGTIITNDVYTNGRTSMIFKCINCGHEFKTQAQHLVSPSNPTSCPKCSIKKRIEESKLTKDEINERVKREGNNEYEIIDWLEYENVRSLVKFKHLTDNHEFNMTVNNFFNGQRCPLHRYDGIKDYMFKPKSHEYYINRIKNECFDYDEYEFLENFENSYDKVKIKHKTCGHEYSVSATKFLAGKRCPNCAMPQKSKAMKEIKYYLDNHNISYTIEESFANKNNPLRNPEDTAFLRLDIYIESLNLAIEYDGEFHDTENLFNKGRLSRYQLLDSIKNKYCEDNNIRLLRIHYSKKDEITQILDKYLNPTTIESIFNENLVIEEKRLE